MNLNPQAFEQEVFSELNRLSKVMAQPKENKQHVTVLLNWTNSIIGVIPLILLLTIFIIASQGDNLFIWVAMILAAIILILIGHYLYISNRTRKEKEIQDLLKNLLNQKPSDKDRKNITIAAELLKKKKVRALICPALTILSNDAFEITKILIPLFWSVMAVAGIKVDPTPTILAALALLISRMGVASLCEDYKKKEEK